MNANVALGLATIIFTAGSFVVQVIFEKLIVEPKAAKDRATFQHEFDERIERLRLELTFDAELRRCVAGRKVEALMEFAALAHQVLTGVTTNASLLGVSKETDPTPIGEMNLMWGHLCSVAPLLTADVYQRLSDHLLYLQKLYVELGATPELQRKIELALEAGSRHDEVMNILRGELAIATSTSIAAADGAALAKTK